MNSNSEVRSWGANHGDLETPVEAEQARAIAKTTKNASAMVAATTLKARLCGLLVDRIEDMVAREKLAAERESIGEVRKAGPLLAAAAVSLDLPERATPAQIVGALAQREIHHARSVPALTRKQDGGK